MRTRLFSIVAAGVLFSSAPASRTIDDAADVRAARAAQNEAIARQDIERAATFWVDDVQVTAGLGSTLHGREAYRQAFLADAGMIYRREPDEVKVSPNWPVAWETGVWTGRHGKGGAPLLAGRYAAQWFKQDGRWRIRSEVFVALDCSGAACGWPARPQ